MVAVSVASSGGPTATMYMNRPFFYAIRDDDNGALLFVGLLTNPSSS